MANRTIVAGDVHVGSANANTDAFGAFLDQLYRDRTSLSDVVLLGDLWDMIRRDPFGCAWEGSEVLSGLKRLAGEVPVHYVLGNHDACLRSLDASRYDVHLHDELVLDHDGTTIRFRHGNEFDRGQFDVLSNYLSGPGDRGEIDPTGGRKDPVVDAVRDGVQRAKGHLASVGVPVASDPDAPGRSFPRRERRAHAYLAEIPEDKLIYGHTHAPYVHPSNAVANPGSWMATAPQHDTYLVVEDGHVELYAFHEGGKDERIE